MLGVFADRRGRATVIFMNGGSSFFPSCVPHGSSFTSLRKTREGKRGEGWRRTAGGWVGVHHHPAPGPAAAAAPQGNSTFLIEAFAKLVVLKSTHLERKPCGTKTRRPVQQVESFHAESSIRC